MLIVVFSLVKSTFIYALHKLPPHSEQPLSISSDYPVANERKILSLVRRNCDAYEKLNF